MNEKKKRGYDMQDNKEFLGKAPLGKLLFRLALPTVVAQLVNMLYNVVDRVFIGHMAEDGDLALTHLVGIIQGGKLGVQEGEDAVDTVVLHAGGDNEAVHRQDQQHHNGGHGQEQLHVDV